MTERLPITKTYKLAIGGKFPRTESGRTTAVNDAGNNLVAHVCRASRKDVRDAVEAAGKAFSGWSSSTAYLRGQILYRLAEMMEGKRSELANAIGSGGENEVNSAIDRVVHFAGWTDKFPQVLGNANPVAGPYHNFTIPQPMGVVGVITPDTPSLLGLVSLVAPVIAAGNTCIVLASETNPIPSMVLAEALATRRAVQADGAGGYATDARVIATSRVPLAPLVAAGAFDAELLRRLEPLGIDVPPLRDRAEDLQSLVLVALDRACRVAGRPVMGIDPDALEALAAHDWPGNLRELASVIDRAVADARGKNVKLGDVPPLAPAFAPADPFEGTYAEIEGEVLRRALERAEGNKSEAARLLELKRTTFIDKLKRHGLHTTQKKKPTSEASPPAA